jgi:hypothetical protein
LSYPHHGWQRLTAAVGALLIVLSCATIGQLQMAAERWATPRRSQPLRSFPVSTTDSMPMDVPDEDGTDDIILSDLRAECHDPPGSLVFPLGGFDSGLVSLITLRCYLSMCDQVAVVPQAMHFLPNGEHGPPVGEEIAVPPSRLLLPTDGTVTALRYPASLLFCFPNQPPNSLLKPTIERSRA